MPSQSKVCFFFEKKKVTLKDRTRLKAFIESIFRREKKKLKSINYVFTSDQQLLKINREYLNHDYFTDIISFDLSEGIATNAEVYISVDRVADNAKRIDTTFQSELHRVIFHGALHLCGYSDKTKKDVLVMRQKEDSYLALYF